MAARLANDRSGSLFDSAFDTFTPTEIRRGNTPYSSVNDFPGGYVPTNPDFPNPRLPGLEQPEYPPIGGSGGQGGTIGDGGFGNVTTAPPGADLGQPSARITVRPQATQDQPYSVFRDFFGLPISRVPQAASGGPWIDLRGGSMGKQGATAQSGGVAEYFMRGIVVILGFILVGTALNMLRKG